MGFDLKYMYWYLYNSIASAIDEPIPCTTLAAHRFDKKQFRKKTFNAGDAPTQPCTIRLYHADVNVYSI